MKQSTHDRHGSQRNQNSSSRSMQEVVERVTLENVCERRINDISRQPHAALARGSGSGSGGVVRSKALVHGSQLRFADIRKQVSLVIMFAGAGSAASTASLDHHAVVSTL